MRKNNMTTKHIKIKDIKQRESLETMIKANTPIKTIPKYIGGGERTIRNEIKRSKI